MEKIYLLSFFVLLFVIIGAESATAQKEFKLNESYPAANTGYLDIKATGAKIRLIGTGEDQIRVNASYRIETKGLKIGNKEPVSLTVNSFGDTLKIREVEPDGRRVLIGSKDVNYTITIDAPAQTNLILKGEENNYFIRNFNGSFFMKGKKVKGELQWLDGTDFNFDLNDSMLEMEGGSGRLIGNLDKSSVSFNNARFGFIDVDLDNVNITLGLEMDDTGEYNFNLNKGKLDFLILSGGGTFNIKHNDQRIFTRGRFIVEKNEKKESIFIREGGSANVFIDTQNGKVILTTAEAKAQQEK